MRKLFINLLLLIGISIIIYVIFWIGLDWGYAYSLKGGVNAFAKLFSIKMTAFLEETESGHPLFKLITSQAVTRRFALEFIILPIVILISWHIFLIIKMPSKRLIKPILINFAILYFIHVIHLMLMNLYSESKIVEILAHTLFHSGMVIVVFLMIKDLIFMPLYKQIRND